jgi:gluconokinase
MVVENDSVLNKLRRIVPLTIIVMGVSGCGKSTLGTELAGVIGCRFLEGDTLHSDEAIAKMRDGQALSDEDRRPWLERVGQAVGTVVKEDGVVVAACSALKRVYRDRLRQIIGAPVFFVLLEAGHEELSRRFAKRSGHFMPVDLLSSQLLTLERPQADELALTVDARRPPAALCDLIIGDVVARSDGQGAIPSPATKIA